MASGDGCSSKCKLETGYSCPNVGTPCIQNVCGNGLKESSEACDDGSKNDGKGCTSDCSGVISGWNCLSGSTTTPSACSTVCGDGIMIEAETCDD